MAADFRQFDEHGLPLPQRFSDLKYEDEAPSRPKISPRAKRLALLAMFLCLIALIFGPQLLSFARGLGADWLADRAERKLMAGDYAGALTKYNQAIDWNPDDWQLYRNRAGVHLEMHDLDGSLADLTKAIEILESGDDQRLFRRRNLPRSMVLAFTYSDRSMIYVRLNRRDEALNDATQALREEPQSTFLNGRAYVRALLNTELAAGLTDVDEALAKNREEQQKLRIQGTSLSDVDLEISELRVNEAEYLDTRGYLLHLLDRNEEALKELDRALRFQEQHAPSRIVGSMRDFELAIKNYQQSLAVMYHHRGLVYRKLDRKEEAAQDLKRGDDLGYDPDRGVF